MAADHAVVARLEHHASDELPLDGEVHVVLFGQAGDFVTLPPRHVGAVLEGGLMKGGTG